MNKNKGREETKQNKVLKAKLLEVTDRNVTSRSSQSLLDVRLPVCLFSEDLTGMRVEFPKTKVGHKERILRNLYMRDGISKELYKEQT